MVCGWLDGWRAGGARRIIKGAILVEVQFFHTVLTARSSQFHRKGCIKEGLQTTHPNRCTPSNRKRFAPRPLHPLSPLQSPGAAARLAGRAAAV